MKAVDIREFEQQFVIHFGGPLKRVNAYTLASTLVSIADAAKSANTLINPGYEIEVVVEAFSEGSFKAKIKTVYKGANNLFTQDNLKAIVLGVIASFIYQHTLAPENEVNVKVDNESVIIEQGDQMIIIPRTVHEALEQVEKSKKFKEDVGRVFEAVEKDPNVESFGITRTLTDDVPEIEIPRDKFPFLVNEIETIENERQVIEIATVQILKAILERSKRRWEFVWRGIKISGPLTDQRFYNDFFDHKVTIAPGDALEVKMKIYQHRHPDTGIYTNSGYEIIEVIRHIPKLKQSSIEIAGM